MEWICPGCGYMNENGSDLCVCGFQQSDVGTHVPADLQAGGDPMEAVGALKKSLADHACVGLAAREVRGRKAGMTEKGVSKRFDTASLEHSVLKEIGAWKFSYSSVDEYVYIGTPVLDPFCLKVTIGDLEEILETVYERTGAKKTLRKRELPKEDVNDLVQFMEEMIDAKKAMIKLSFSPEELDAVTELVNRKLAD